MTAQRKSNGDTATAFVRRHIGPSPRDVAAMPFVKNTYKR